MATRKAITSDKAPAAIGPYSQAITVDGMIYTSGVVPLIPGTKDLDGTTIETQAERVLTSLSALLEDAGSSLDNVVKTTCFLQNLDDYATFNEIYGKHFSGDAAPARSAVQVAKLPLGALVEIEAVALLK